MLRTALTLLVASVLFAGCSDAREDPADLLRKANAGDMEAQWDLGWMYSDGSDVPIDYKEALKWYRKAAEQGHALAQWQLGFMYDRGTGVTRDEEEAVKWWRKAAEQGHSIAQNKLGRRYFKGGGVLKKDYVAAYAWYSVAVNGQELRSLAELMTLQQIAEGQALSRKLYERIEANNKKAEAKKTN